jgi:hypothetical protein
MKIADGNHHVCGTKINMGNVNCHERALSNESHHIVGGMLVVHEGCERMVCLTPHCIVHVPLHPFQKYIQKNMNPTSPLREHGGRGDEN